MLYRRGAKIGLPRLHAHQFRHTFADDWLEAGGNEGDLMRIMGWRSRHMLDRYGAAAQDRRARRNGSLAGHSHPAYPRSCGSTSQSQPTEQRPTVSFDLTSTGVRICNGRSFSAGEWRPNLS
jgi:hypothetical protein